MLAMWLSRKYTSSAYSEIGQFYGGRSHSTVIAAQQKMQRWVEANETIAVSDSRCGVQDAIRRIESSLRVG